MKGINRCESDDKKIKIKIKFENLKENCASRLKNEKLNLTFVSSSNLYASH